MNNLIVGYLQSVWKWSVCSWLHRTMQVWTNGVHFPKERHRVSGRCYPRVDIPEGQPGADYWHCVKCHPCGEELDFLTEKKDG